MLQNKLISNLHKFLKGYEKNLKKRANEELRKKRLEYVGISFSNILFDEQTAKKAKASEKPESDRTGNSDEYSEEESDDEPSYKLRIRRQVNVSHRLNEYDELMNLAIQVSVLQTFLKAFKNFAQTYSKLIVHEITFFFFCRGGSLLGPQNSGSPVHCPIPLI